MSNQSESPAEPHYSPSEYEKKREANVRANKDLLRKLGFDPDKEDTDDNKKKKKKKSSKKKKGGRKRKTEENRGSVANSGNQGGASKARSVNEGKKDGELDARAKQAAVESKRRKGTARRMRIY